MIHLGKLAYKKYKKHKENQIEQGKEPFPDDRVYPPGEQKVSQDMSSGSHESTNSGSIADGKGTPSCLHPFIQSNVLINETGQQRTNHAEYPVAELEQKGKWIFIPEGAERGQRQTNS